MPQMSNRVEIEPVVSTPRTVHPSGSRARVLLTSVFGPYAQDDEYGSRVLNPMELYHNQVTRVQGPFSLRMFHRSWGLMLIQANLQAPCTVLDFPSLDRFIEEIRNNPYDVVGISSIIPNMLKVRKMCELIRQYQPEATIVVGGHIANVPDLDERIDADEIVKGDGVRWFRGFLGEDQDRPLNHPIIESGTVIDQYTVIRRLALGGMSEVYLARDMWLDRNVALKIIYPEILAIKRLKEQFWTEVKIVAKFNHPHVITIYGVGEYQGRKVNPDLFHGI